MYVVPYIRVVWLLVVVCIVNSAGQSGVRVFGGRCDSCLSDVIHEGQARHCVSRIDVAVCGAMCGEEEHDKYRVCLMIRK